MSENTNIGESIIKSVSDKFDELLESSLTKSQYDNLDILLGVKKHKKTRILNDPKTCPTRLIPIFARLIGLHPLELMRDYQLGADVTPHSTYNFYLSDFEKKQSPIVKDKAA